jgi:hypothetical protein
LSRRRFNSLRRFLFEVAIAECINTARASISWNSSARWKQSGEHYPAVVKENNHILTASRA